MKTILLSLLLLHICLTKKIINRQAFRVLSKSDNNNYVMPSDRDGVEKSMRRFTDSLKDDYLIGQLEKHSNKSKCFSLSGIQGRIGRVNASRILVDMTVYRNESMLYDLRLNKEYQLQQKALKKALDSSIQGLLDEFRQKNTYLSKNIQGMLIMETGLQILYAMKSPEMAPPSFTKISDAQMDRFDQMFASLQAALEKADLPKTLLDKYSASLAAILEQIRADRNVTLETANRFIAWMHALQKEEELVDDHHHALDARQRIQSDMLDLQGFKAAKQVFYQLISLNRRVIEDDLVQQEANSFSSLRKEVDSLMNNTNPTVVQQIRQSMEGILRLDFPDITSYSKKQLQDWLYSSMFAKDMNALLAKVSLESRDWTGERSEQAVRLLLDIQSTAQDIVYTIYYSDSDNKSNIDRLKTLLSQLALLFPDSPGILALIKRIASILDFLRNPKFLDLPAQELSVQEVKMFESYEQCSQIKASRERVDRMTRDFPMKSFFFVNLRFFYEMNQVLNTVLYNNHCQIGKIFESFFDSFGKSRSVEQVSKVFGQQSDPLAKRIQQDHQLIIDQIASYEYKYCNQTLQEFTDFQANFQNILQSPKGQQDKTLKMLRTFGKYQKSITTLKFQESFNEAFNRYQSRTTDSIHTKYTQFFETVVKFSQQLDYWNLKIDSSIMIYKILLRYYANLSKLLGQLRPSKNKHLSSYSNLVSVHRRLFNVISLNINNRVVDSYLKKNPEQKEDLHDFIYSSPDELQYMVGQSYRNLTKDIMDYKVSLDPSTYDSFLDVKNQVAGIIDGVQSLETPTPNRPQKKAQVLREINQLQALLLQIRYHVSQEQIKAQLDSLNSVLVLQRDQINKDKAFQ